MATIQQNPPKKKGAKLRVHVDLGKAENDAIAKIKRAFHFEFRTQAVRFAVKEVAKNIK